MLTVVTGWLRVCLEKSAYDKAKKVLRVGAVGVQLAWKNWLSVRPKYLLTVGPVVSQLAWKNRFTARPKHLLKVGPVGLQLALKIGSQ